MTDEGRQADVQDQHACNMAKLRAETHQPIHGEMARHRVHGRRGRPPAWGVCQAARYETGVVAGGSADHCGVRFADGSLPCGAGSDSGPAVKLIQSPTKVSRVEPVQTVRPAVKWETLEVSRVEPGRATVI